MKRTFAKRGLMSLVAGFFLVGFMLFSASRASAQSLNWVGVDEAKTRLITAVDQQHSIMNANPQGSQSYTNAFVRARYFKNIYRLISDGVPVPEAVDGGLGVAGTEPDPTAPSGQSNPQSPANSLKDEAVDLLTD